MIYMERATDAMNENAHEMGYKNENLLSHG